MDKMDTSTSRHSSSSQNLPSSGDAAEATEGGQKTAQAQIARLRELAEAVRQGPAPLPSACIHR